MEIRFNYKKARVEVLDFMSSLERLENSVEILDTYYDLCIAEYKDFWRINALVGAVVYELREVMSEGERVKKLFLD